MKTLSLPLVIALVGACASPPASSGDGDESEGALVTNPASPVTIPTSCRSAQLGSAGTLRYNQQQTKVYRPIQYGVSVTTLTLSATLGDEVDIVVSGRGPTANPAVVVLGSVDPVELAKCREVSHDVLRKHCYERLTRPVVASNDDADATTKDARLRHKLTDSTLTIGVLGVSVFDVVVRSVASALDTTSCVANAGAPLRGDHGSFDRVTLERDCKGTQCSPWRELGRESRNGNKLVVGYAPGSSTEALLLVDNDGPFGTFHQGGLRVTEDCTATTVCSLSQGRVRCDDWLRATVVRRGATAIDSDQCDSQLTGAFDKTTPRFSGVLGARCASLTGGIRTTTVPGGRTETQTVIVKAW